MSYGISIFRDSKVLCYSAPHISNLNFVWCISMKCVELSTYLTLFDLLDFRFVAVSHHSSHKEILKF